MDRISRGFAVFFILIMAVSSLSLMMVKPANAQSIPKPSVPELSLRYMDYSYSYHVPPTYQTNQFTGEKEISGGDYDVSVVNRTVEFKIKNQSFNGYTDSNGNYIGLYYHIRYKGNYGNTWSDNPQAGANSIVFQDTLVFPATNTEYSEIAIFDARYQGNLPEYPTRFSSISLPTQGKVDFQVQALTGHGTTFNANGILGDFAIYNYNFSGQMSEWSNAQTITIGETSSTSPTPNPTPTPAVPEFPLLVVLPLFLSMLSIAIILKLRKQRTPKNML